MSLFSGLTARGQGLARRTHDILGVWPWELVPEAQHPSAWSVSILETLKVFANEVIPFDPVGGAEAGTDSDAHDDEDEDEDLDAVAAVVDGQDSESSFSRSQAVETIRRLLLAEIDARAESRTPGVKKDRVLQRRDIEHARRARLQPARGDAQEHEHEQDSLQDSSPEPEQQFGPRASNSSSRRDHVPTSSASVLVLPSAAAAAASSSAHPTSSPPARPAITKSRGQSLVTTPATSAAAATTSPGSSGSHHSSFLGLPNIFTQSYQRLFGPVESPTRPRKRARLSSATSTTSGGDSEAGSWARLQRDIPQQVCHVSI